MPIAEGRLGAGQVDPASATPALRGEGVSAGRILAAIGMALLGFIVTAGLIHAAIPDPLHLHADIRSEKLAMLEQWRGKYFSASFGSSHVHDGFNPAVFDAAVMGSPAASSTMNLAVEGGSQSEQFSMAQEFLRRLEPPGAVGAASQPCTVILELNAGVNLIDLVQTRTIDIYNWHTTRLLLDFTDPSMSLIHRGARLGFTLAATGLHYLNVGMLSNLIFAPPLNEHTMASQTQDDRRGQDVMPYTPSNVARLHRRVDGLERPAATQPALLYPGNSKLIERLARESPVRHVSFVYIVMPFIDGMSSVVRYPDHLTVDGPDGPLQVPIVNLAQPAVYPELYDPELWFDESHLNGKGSVVLTRILGEYLKKWYAAHGGPPPCG